jgi:hypothetical protein
MCNYGLHVDEEEDMQTVLCPESAGAPAPEVAMAMIGA